MDSKYDIIVSTISQNFNNKINYRSQVLDLTKDVFNKQVNNKLNSECAKYFEKLLSVSQQDYQQETSTLSIKSKTGLEKEYNDITKDIMKCIIPFKVIFDKISIITTMYNQLSSQSYNTCTDDCKKIFTSSKKFKLVKPCLQDCLNLSLTNFNAYEQYTNDTIKKCEIELKI